MKLLYAKLKFLFLFGFSFQIFIFSNAYCQYEADKWMYDNTYFISFNKATVPQAIRYPCMNCVPYRVGVTTYCDNKGDLIFYSDGNYVFDRDFGKVPAVDEGLGGTPLLGCGFSPTFPSQGVLGVPRPGQPNQYLLFHIYSGPQNNYKSPLYYSLFDKSLNNGKGDIVGGIKNVQLLGGTDVAYKLTAVLHCNKRDIWVVGHLSNSSRYFALLVTPNGVSENPVYFDGTFIPLINSAGITKENDVGCIKVSPTGTKLAAAFKGLDFVELLDFDNSSGVASNLKIIKTVPLPADTTNAFGTGYTGPYGVEFSPSGKLLYVSSTYRLRSTVLNGIGAFIFQYNTNQQTQQLVQSSQYQVCKLDSGIYAGALQIANNGKLYFNASQDLYAIANPEQEGAACNFYGPEIDIGNQFPNMNLPGYLQSYFTNSIVVSNNCRSDTLLFSLKDTSGIGSVQWNFDDTASGSANTSNGRNPVHIFSTPGVYRVCALINTNSQCGSDTVCKYVSAGGLPLDLGRDTFVCRNDSVVLRVNLPYVDILWSNGLSDSSIVIKQEGFYSVSVSIGDCIAADSITIIEKAPPLFSLGNDTIICKGNTYSIFPMPALLNVNYSWSTGSTLNSVNVSPPQNVSLKVTDEFGCSYSDTISVLSKQVEGFDIGRDTTLCVGDSVLLDASFPGINLYSWNIGYSGPTLMVITSGTYSCSINLENCTYEDSAVVIFNPVPEIHLGADTAICNGTSLLLRVVVDSSDYLWQDGSVNSTFLVTQAGNYFVRVARKGCVSSDTIHIKTISQPYFNLGPDQSICSGSKILLKPDVNDSWLLRWQDGSMNPSFDVKNAGVYFLEARNQCGVFRDEVIFSEVNCELYIPSAFSPNGDSRNDFFRISGQELLVDYRLQIFNRYGQVVYETLDKYSEWDGMFKGRSQPVGVYTWLMQFKSLRTGQKSTKRGTLILIR